MRPEMKAWTCGQCQRTILVPLAHGDDWLGHLDALARIREHRFGHLTEALMRGSDEDLWALCEDEPAAATSFSPEFDFGPTDQSADACLSRLGNLANCAPPELVDSDDVTPMLEGISELLRADLPWARRVWYPINEDGGFNR